MANINKAYDTLSNEEKRAEYDESRKDELPEEDPFFTESQGGSNDPEVEKAYVGEPEENDSWVWVMLLLGAFLFIIIIIAIPSNYVKGMIETLESTVSVSPIRKLTKLSASNTGKGLVERPSADVAPMAIPFDIAIQAALEGHTDTVLQALATGTKPNQIDENGRTLLMMSAFNGHTSIAKTLLEAGTKIDTQDLDGRTALMYASTGNDIPTITLLLKNKANVNLVDGEEHWTALMFAAAEGHQEVVELLLNNESDITLVDIDGESAELFARNNGHIEVADFLKAYAEKQ
jgi:hypothetical protein